jgi:hypothetical protein
MYLATNEHGQETKLRDASGAKLARDRIFLSNRKYYAHLRNTKGVKDLTYWFTRKVNKVSFRALSCRKIMNLRVCYKNLGDVTNVVFTR